MSNTVWLDRDPEWGRQQVERFVRSFQPSYRLLAYHAALPSILTPELVNYLRNKFLRQEGVPWIAEVDLLLSDLCQPVGYEQYAMEASVRAYLVENLEQFLGKDRMEEVARLLIGYLNRLARRSSALQRPELKAQQWAAMVYLDDRRGEAVGEIVQAFLDASVAEGTKDLLLASRWEMDRLSRITQELAPQLNNYPNLLEYAQLISQIVADPNSVEREVVMQSFFLAEGMTLKVPEFLVSAQNPEEQNNLDSNTDLQLTENITPGSKIASMYEELEIILREFVTTSESIEDAVLVSDLAELLHQPIQGWNEEYVFEIATLLLYTTERINNRSDFSQIENIWIETKDSYLIGVYCSSKILLLVKANSDGLQGRLRMNIQQIVEKIKAVIGSEEFYNTEPDNTKYKKNISRSYYRGHA